MTTAAKRRFAQVGLGGRSAMYTRAITGRYSEACELVGLCDVNPGRLRQAVEAAREAGAEVPGYEADAFDRMIGETKPDSVIVTTMDCAHDYYICRAMELGCDAITEKPMTIDEDRCRRIIETRRRTGKKCTVTFNYRYSPPRTQVKDILMSGVIGDILSVEFQWHLDTHHGADYFRRWHRRKANSGGLMVHKATHHFDLVNWWLSTVPVSVFATGQRRFYTPRQAERYGLTRRAERCLDCPEAGRCAFYMDLRGNEPLRKRYLDNEGHDGYFRDRCVFSDEIDIEDCMNVVVDYASGAKMSYSLNAFLPWEGYSVAFNGTRGRVEHVCQESVYINGDGTVPGELLADGTTIKVYPHFKTARSVAIQTGAGGHGGGDSPLLDDILDPHVGADKYLRAADERAGAYSILVGIAANHSMASGQVVRIDELVEGLEAPEYPPMPSPEDPVPMEKPDIQLVSPYEAQRRQAEQARSGGGASA